MKGQKYVLMKDENGEDVQVRKLSLKERHDLWIEDHPKFSTVEKVLGGVLVATIGVLAYSIGETAGYNQCKSDIQEVTQELIEERQKGNDKESETEVVTVEEF